MTKREKILLIIIGVLLFAFIITSDRVIVQNHNSIASIGFNYHMEIFNNVSE